MRIEKELPLALLAVSLFVLCSVAYIDLPGLHYDEVLFVNASLPGDDGSFISWSLPFQGRRFPLMLMGYIGAVKAYLYTPVFVLFGRTPLTVRLPVVLIGVATLLFTYCLVKTALDKKVGLTTLLLLASDPSFIFANRLDWGPVSLGLFLKVSSLHFLLGWLNEGKPRQLIWASFLMGLGVYDKVTFLWFLASLMVALPLCCWKQLKPRLNPRSLAVSFSWFLIGCLPFIAYNLRGPGRTFKQQEVLNRSPLESARDRYKLFKATLNGEELYYFINRQPLDRFAEITDKKNEQSNPGLLRMLAGLSPVDATLTPEALWLAIGVIVGLWLADRLKSKAQVMFFLLLFVLMTLFIWATAQAGRTHHVLSVYPLPHILISISIWKIEGIRNMVPKWKGARSFPILAVASIVFLLFSQLVISARYLVSFKSNGGVGPWSDAIYDLVDYSREHSNYTYQLMDWGFNNQLRVLGETDLSKTEAFRAVGEAAGISAKVTAMQAYIAKPNSFLVFHAPNWEVFPLLDVFRQALAKYGTEAQLVKTFYQQDGQPAYLLYRTHDRSFEDYLGSGGFFYLREAEKWDAKSGGAVDFKVAASLNKALGRKWGRQVSDFVTYRFDLPHEVSAGQLYLSYAVSRLEPQLFHLYLDRRLLDTLALRPTGGDGNATDQWRVFKVKIGPLEAGDHEITIKPAAPSQLMTLDYFYLCEGDCKLRS